MNNIFKSGLLLDSSKQASITYLFGDMILKAEGMFGKRDHTYTLLGIEIYEGENPCLTRFDNTPIILIQITKECEFNMNQAVFQVSHEVIHCLSPVNFGVASVLEEGLATYFSFYYLQSINISWNCDIPANYDSAYLLVLQLLSIDDKIILKLRELEPTISNFTAELLLSVNSAIPRQLAQIITQKFQN